MKHWTFEKLSRDLATGRTFYLCLKEMQNETTFVPQIPTFAFSMTLANSPTHRKQWWGESRRKQSPLLREEARGSTSRVCTCLLPEHEAEGHRLPREEHCPVALAGPTGKHPHPKHPCSQLPILNSLICSREFP